MKNFLFFLLFLFFVLVSFSSYSQVGINTPMPMSTLDINGNLSIKVITLTGSGSTTQIDDGVYISLNPTSNNQLFNLPSAIDFPGRYYILRNINNSNTADISSSGGNFFYKNTTSEANTSTHKVYLYEGNRTLFIISDGSNWTVFN